MISPISRPPPDDELARRSQQGDRDALDQLLRRHQERIYALCRRLAGNHADALDATQEALITIARRIDRFDGRSSFGTWAYRVATNACLDELRRRKRRPEPVDATEAPGMRLEGPFVGPGRTDANHADHATTLADRFELDAALALLPEDFRVAVVLRDVLTLDYAEIAEVAGVPIGTVRSRIARGRSLLATQLEAGGNHRARLQRQSPESLRPQATPLGRHNPDQHEPEQHEPEQHEPSQHDAAAAPSDAAPLAGTDPAPTTP